ncbi:acyl-ACP desaturase [Flagellatimonas centrodinii]|uniref:acyl-ACP desaturase n=1 Tax=Flagellatimonas centrodinii TaxID=2806210 RepID=UPI001FEE0CAA|nr:acyl-ACP desaturase [Flagellatimonas centrodinii]ULQ48204.1 acyl-ACP desaturase [Flagellatimonas centrodinii]
MTGLAPPARFGTPDQIEVLVAMEPFVRNQMKRHVDRRKLWFPNDLMPADATLSSAADAELARLRDAARGIPDAARVALALNLLTEEGLPHFHRLIASHMGNESVWREWNNLWTAEEDRHGCALRDYVRDARLFNMGELERQQYAYIEAGFDPDWQRDPYRLLAYTSLQEKATQVSHANTGRLCADVEPTAQRVMAHLAGDEGRHYEFYRACFGEVLARDPNRALQALQSVTLGFAMPGHAIDGFDAMSDLVRRAGIFGTRQYQRIVEELWAHWNLAGMVGLSAVGRACLDKLMAVPARLAKLADYSDRKEKPRTFAFAFLDGRTVTL